MNTTVAPDLDLAVCLLLILLVPFAAAGLMLMNTGLGRSRSAAHTMLACLCMLAVAALAYMACGFALQGFGSGSFYSISLGGKRWDVAGAGTLFLAGVKLNGSPQSLGILLAMFGAGIGAMIPFGAGSDRFRLSACCLSAAVFAGLIFPLFSHWVWGGWLAQLGLSGGLGHGFLDTGGAAAIHASGGLAALSLAWILGPRRGKYSDGVPTALPGHDAVLVIFGCVLALVGWMGLNGAGAILYNHMASGGVVLVAVNTLLSASAAALAAAAITRARYNRPDASLCVNGWTGGLVASSAVAAFASPLAAALIGLIAGALVAFSVEALDARLAIDDPGGAISVHGAAGIWGLLAVGFFSQSEWLAQIAGVATLLGFVFPLTYGTYWVLNRFHPLRVAPEGERTGMDLHELGAGAYPEFVTHHDDLFSR
jgi:Amt family ammonium transporter